MLVVVPSVTAGTWLMDTVSLLAGDRRITTFFATAPLEKGEWHRFDLVMTVDAHGLVRLGGEALAGDLRYDQLLASIPFRAGYRRALGLSREQKLVLVASTVDTVPDLLERLLVALPQERYRVAPLVSPEAWRATLLAANLVVGGSGAVTRYGAAIGVPVLLATSAEDGPRGGADELVRRHAPRLCRERPLLHQVEAAMRADRAWQDRVAERITSVPGYAGDVLRRRVYELLDLAEPPWPVPCPPVPLGYSASRSSLVNSAR